MVESVALDYFLDIFASSRMGDNQDVIDAIEPKVPQVMR